MRDSPLLDTAKSSSWPIGGLAVRASLRIAIVTIIDLLWRGVNVPYVPLLYIRYLWLDSFAFLTRTSIASDVLIASMDCRPVCWHSPLDGSI